MDQRTHSKQADSGQRAARIRKLIHSEMRTPVEVQRRNAEVRATQWEPVVGLPKGVDSLGKMATAGVIS